MDYMVVHWDGMEAIAHSMLSFEFKDGRHLAFSVETRTDKKDEFGALPGLYKQFELIFIAGTEEDLIGLRTNYRHEDVYLYRTTLTAKDAQTLFRSLLARMNRLREQPEFYNTITRNCLTSLDPVGQRAESFFHRRSAAVVQRLFRPPRFRKRHTRNREKREFQKPEAAFPYQPES